jgi:septal ring factor EnvC (AmiA/AmiB activator)
MVYTFDEKEKEKKDFEETLRELEQRCADLDAELARKTEAMKEMDKQMDAKRLGH